MRSNGVSGAALAMMAVWPLVGKCATVPFRYQEVAEKYSLPSALVYAIATVESHKIHNGYRAPWPWTLNIEGKPYFYKTRAQAEHGLQRYLNTGKQSVAVGPMQVYWRWHKQKFMSPEHALDPEKNLDTGASILRECYEKRQSWEKAVHCYYGSRIQRENVQYARDVLREFLHIQRDDRL